MQYLFILGSTPTLSIQEIESVINHKVDNHLSSDVVSIESSTTIDCSSLINRLGGTVKIALVEKIVSDKANIINEISDILLQKENIEKITFGISFHGGNLSGKNKQLSKDIKNYLGKKGRRIRYVLPLGNSLSSVQVVKEKITEIILVEYKNQFIIGKTQVVQDFEDWGKRDYQRPCADPKSGMLPPKVARMMLNIALPNSNEKNISDQKPIVLDPFCGVGTIGAEGLMVGCWVILSDKDEITSKKAEKNMKWLCKIYDLPEDNFKVYCSDATNISKYVPKNSLDVIVTEPYLGPPMETKNGSPAIKGKRLNINKLENIIKGLEKLYIGCLREWKTILKPGGIIVMAIPEIVLGNTKYSVKNIIDSCERLGYTNPQGPFSYSRPQAVVRRMFYIFKK